MNEKGVTLMELIVVVAIVGTIAAIVVLSTGDMRRVYAVRAAAREVYGDLQRARLAAIREGRSYSICFAPVDTSTASDRVFTSYFVVLGAGADNTFCTSDDIRPDRWATKDIAAMHPGMTFTEGFSGTRATFQPTGKASSGNVKVMTVGSTKTVKVNQFTGNVRIE